MVITQEAPRAALGSEYGKLSGTKKIGEIGQWKGRLLLPGGNHVWEGDFSTARFRLFSPDAKHPAWRLSAAVSESDKSVRSFDFNLLQATAGTPLS